MNAPDREVVPTLLCPEDPWAGDEVRYAPGDWGNGRRYGLALDPAAWAVEDRRVHGLLREVVEGRRGAEDAELQAALATLCVPTALKHDTRPPRVAEVEVPDEVLADVVEDVVPDLAMTVERIWGDAPDVPLGAWAALAFLGVAIEGRRPLDIWADEETDRALVRAARVIDACPPCLWVDGRPAIPFSRRWTPPVIPPGVFVARAYRVGEGWAFAARVDLPAVPAVGPLLRRLRLELWDHRRTERRASFEDMLRARSTVPYRASVEATLTARPDGGPGGAVGGAHSSATRSWKVTV